VYYKNRCFKELASRLPEEKKQLFLNFVSMFFSSALSKRKGRASL